MSKRSDIKNGKKSSTWLSNYGLIYTCNAGWVDLGHLNPNSKRPEIGATNLWAQLLLNGNTAPSSSKIGQGNVSSRVKSLVKKLNKPDDIQNNNRFTFSDKTTGFRVIYRQDHGGIPLKPGQEIEYLVRNGLSIEQKKRVALSIFMEVSLKFELFQKNLGLLRLTDSGFSQEDLVSNLIGFYIAINEVSRMKAIEVCHPVSDKTAFFIWDNDGPVGKNKNKSWSPKHASRTNFNTRHQCIDECALAARTFPKEFQKIQPAPLGLWHQKF